LAAAMADRGDRGDREPRIFATEEDRVNCPFYLKIGACRNGDRCNRAHVRPQISQTVLLPHMFPTMPDGLSISNDEDWDDEMYDRAQEHVEAFYEEVFLELAQYGEIEDIVVLDNVSDHMLGNVYCKYYHDQSAERAMRGLPGRFYGGKLLQPEFSPVTDFREARCRAFHETRCVRGGLCNFMHSKHIPRAVKRRVIKEMYEEHPEFAGKPPRNRSRSPRGQQGEVGKKKRQTSEERRAMIEGWNRELQAEEQQAAEAGIPMTRRPITIG